MTEKPNTTYIYCFDNGRRVSYPRKDAKPMKEKVMKEKIKHNYYGHEVELYLVGETFEGKEIWHVYGCKGSSDIAEMAMDNYLESKGLDDTWSASVREEEAVWFGGEFVYFHGVWVYPVK